MIISEKRRLTQYINNRMDMLFAKHDIVQAYIELI